MSDFAAQRRMMVDNQIRPSDVTKYPVIDAMQAVPREEFVPDQLRAIAYCDCNIDLGQGRAILEPRTLAKLLDALNVEPDELVLDIGCALGYSSAVIARMAQAVIAVEQDAQLAGEAQETLAETGADNVLVHTGPLAAGAAEHGPYDVIVVEGGVEEVPDALVGQLKEGGRIACLFMENGVGAVRTGYKLNGKMNWRFDFNASAPVLPGFERKTAFAL